MFGIKKLKKQVEELRNAVFATGLLGPVSRIECNDRQINSIIDRLEAHEKELFIKHEDENGNETQESRLDKIESNNKSNFEYLNQSLRFGLCYWLPVSSLVKEVSYHNSYSNTFNVNGLFLLEDGRVIKGNIQEIALCKNKINCYYIEGKSKTQVLAYQKFNWGKDE